MVPQEALYLQSSDESPLPHIFSLFSFPFLAPWWTLGILYLDAVQPLGERGSAEMPFWLSWCGDAALCCQHAVLQYCYKPPPPPPPPLPTPSL